MEGWTAIVGRWDFWVYVAVSLVVAASRLIPIAYDWYVGRVGHLHHMQAVYDCLNEMAAGPNVKRACMLVTRDGKFLSHRTKATCNMLAESSSVGSQREKWIDHQVNEEYLTDLVQLVRKKQHFFNAETTDAALRSLWKSEGTIGAEVYLLKLQYTPSWTWLFGGYGIQAVYYVSANVSKKPTDEDYRHIEAGVDRLKRLYR